MRFLRLLFVAVLAIILISLAFANRQIVTLTAFPAGLDSYIGGRWSLDMPLFVVVFGAICAGVVIGLIWEWLREAHLRAETHQRRNEVAKLEREVEELRTRNAQPRDEILAIVDGPKSGGAGTGRAITSAR